MIPNISKFRFSVCVFRHGTTTQTMYKCHIVIYIFIGMCVWIVYVSSFFNEYMVAFCEWSIISYGVLLVGGENKPRYCHIWHLIRIHVSQRLSFQEFIMSHRWFECSENFFFRRWYGSYFWNFLTLMADIDIPFETIVGEAMIGFEWFTSQSGNFSRSKFFKTRKSLAESNLNQKNPF